MASGRLRFIVSNTPLKSSGYRTPSACTAMPYAVRRRLVSQRYAKIVAVPKHREALQVWHRLLDEVEAFGGQRDRVVGNAGEVAAGPGEAIHEVSRHGIAGTPRNYGRDILHFAGQGGRIADGHDHIRMVSLRGTHHFGQLGILACGTAGLVGEVLADGEALLLEAFQQDRAKRRVGRQRHARCQRCKPKGLGGLGKCDMWGRQRGSGECDKITTLHK
jgi:hypothetical protein